MGLVQVPGVLGLGLVESERHDKSLFDQVVALFCCFVQSYLELGLDCRSTQTWRIVWWRLVQCAKVEQSSVDRRRLLRLGSAGFGFMTGLVHVGVREGLEVLVSRFITTTALVTCSPPNTACD